MELEKQGGKSMKRFNFFVLAIVVGILFFGQGVTLGAAPIKIGVSVPMSGPVGFLGQDQKLGYEMALEEINAAGGVLGRPIKIIYADNQCNPTEGVSAVRKLIDLDKVVALFGCVCSSATLAVMPVIEEAKIPMLTISSTNPRITQMAGVGGNIWEFRLNVDDSIMANTLGKIISEQAKKVVMFAVNNDWGRGAVGAYSDVFKPLGVTLQSAEYFEQGQSDFRPSLTKVKGMNPDALLLIMESRDAVVLVRQMKEIGFRPLIFARGTVVTNEFAEAIHDDCTLGDGIMEATLHAYGVNPKFDKKFEKKYGSKPHWGAGIAYTGLYTMVKAIQLGGKVEPEAIRKGLEKVGYFHKNMGPIHFDDHHQAHPWMVITTMKDCKVEVLKVVETD
jgi:branched-chain amino acid transport system substrate-binding protein